VNGDKTVVITLTPSILAPEGGWIVYLIIAIVISILILIGVMAYKKYSYR